MIHKVNRPDLKLIVSSPKATENDPGSSQGGGVAYEGLPDSKKEPSPENDSGPGSAPPSETDASEEIRSPPPGEQIGLGEVLREFKENQKTPAVRPGLATHYQNEGGNAKGLLLNKKVE